MERSQRTSIVLWNSCWNWELIKYTPGNDMENIYCKMLDKIFCSLTYTACHGYNSFLLWGNFLNAAIVLHCSAAFYSTFRKCASGDHMVRSLLCPQQDYGGFFAQMLAVVRSFMFTYDLACTYTLSTSHTCSQTKPVHIWRSFNVEGMSGGKYSITWVGAGGKFAPSRGQFFLIFMTNTCTYMCSHTCRHTHSVSPEPTGNKAGKNITLVYSTLAAVIFS